MTDDVDDDHHHHDHRFPNDVWFLLHMPSQDGQRICEGCKAYSYCEGCRRKIEGKETHSEGDWDDLRVLETPEGSAWLGVSFAGRNEFNIYTYIYKYIFIFTSKYVDSVKSVKNICCFFFGRFG